MSTMVVDIASHQQLPEIFTSQPTTMTNGHRFAVDDLSKRAELVLGQATALLDYSRQSSYDYATRYPPSRVNISSPTPTQAKAVPSSTTTTMRKDRPSNVLEQLVPLIFQVTKIDRLKRFNENRLRVASEQNQTGDELISSSSFSSFAEHTENVTESREESLQLTDEEENDLPVAPAVPPPPPPPPVPVPIKTKTIRESDEDMSMTSDDENEERDELKEEQTNPLDPTNLSLIDFLRHSQSPVKSPIHQPVQVTSRKEDLVKAFSSSVNIHIDLKQPTLPIAIPKHLFIEPTKRTLDETSTNEPTSKRSKTTAIVQPTATVAPLNNVQPKKEKPTANVKPLPSSSANPNPTPSVNGARRSYTDRLRTSTNRQLDALARELKRKADQSRRTTFDEVRQSMSFYLESVCYFTKCASEEQDTRQRSTLFTDILNMLQQLAQIHQRLFLNGSTQSDDVLSPLRQKFLLINYWLQSYMYQLKFQNNWPAIERCASQVTEYLNQTQSPSFNPNSENHTHLLVGFSKYMFLSYQSTHYWNKADRLTAEPSLKDFLEQLLRQNQNRRLSRDETTVDFILYIFDAIDLLRSTTER